ncbi:glycosyltransferase family 2 protein [Urechidicola vernalis]|uniref:Glycosyltransferase family 2 protein n=1 Tax=Urechidicola vernalis TaxID=3075600 RepID=A0ABU2Y4T0_9FLAO|nr:glycosyltransferase family 2 protein [Urechidicola sp. P050]MDT0552280.1 glycosyltransferase family 2 protein [Urechidicola sp. P050]
MQSNLVSIIIPTYNRAHLITETLNSIIDQSYHNWECIIVDDGSTDNTHELLESFNNDDRILYVKRPKKRPKGVNSCRNYGLEIAKGVLIQWFDSDDLMHPNRIEVMVRILEHGSYKCVISNFSYFRGNLNNKDYQIKPFNNFNNNSLQQGIVSGLITINLQSILWDRTFLREGKFNEKLSYAEDIEFIFKEVIRTNFTFTIFDKVLVYVRKHDSSLTDAFKNRKIDLINDEIKVRYYILNQVYKMKLNSETLKGALKMYLKSIKYLLYINRSKDFYFEFIKVFKITKFNYLPHLILLLVISVSYLFAQRGMSSYQKVINQL